MPPADLDELCQQVRDLNLRVARLEERLAVGAGCSLSHETSAPPAEPVGEVDSPSPLAEAPPSLPVLGAATLGLAGAYLLRAIAESDFFPPTAVVGVGTLYAVTWLFWAARTRNRFAATVYSMTAGLILAPLLWEVTARFQMVGAWQAGVILVAFTLIGLAKSWSGNCGAVATLSVVASLGTAVALLIATHDALPLTFVFLAIAAAVEICAAFNRWLGLRWLSAAAADLSLLLTTWLVTNPQGLPEAYAPIPVKGLLLAQMALLLIYLCSVTVRTLLRGFTFTNFEVVQCAVAFVLGLGGALRLSSEGMLFTPALAGFTFLCGAACYIISFRLLARQASHSRNFYIYSTFAILLFLVGCRIFLNESADAAAWSLLALAGVGAGGLRREPVLEAHGGVYLLLALAASGDLRQSAAFLLGNDAWPGSVQPALWIGLLVAATCYFLAVRLASVEDSGWNQRAYRAALAAALVWVALGWTAGGLTGVYHGLMGTPSGDSYCATLRTGSITLAAVLLASIGSRVHFQDLAQLVYPLMLLGGYRLVAVDLHLDRKPARVLSLFLYGLALMVIPRLRRGRLAH